VTDANIVLGYLDASYFNGGKMKIKPELSHAAIDKKIAKPMGISVVDAARGIHSLANTLMGAAIRIVTLQRGIDPRDHAIIAFGGAGPIHIVHLAQLFDIKEVIVPPSPGVKSAYGLLISDVAYDTVKTLMMKVDNADFATLRKHFDELEAKARGVLGGEVETGTKIVIERYVDMSFATKFQTHPVLVPNRDIDKNILTAAEKEFRVVQHRMFGAESADRCRIMGVRVHAFAPVEIPEQRKVAKAKTGPDAAIKNRRPAWFAAGDGFTETPVYNRSLLGAGHSIVGPAIIEEPDSTTICPPGYTIVVDDELNLIITASEAGKSDKTPKRSRSKTVREPA
jgi:N-methylhydantoinase A